MKIFKKLIPSGAKREVEVVETWVVSWFSVQGTLYHVEQREYEVFTSKESAEKYKIQLKEAFKFIRSSYLTEVKMYKGTES